MYWAKDVWLSDINMRVCVCVTNKGSMIDKDSRGWLLGLRLQWMGTRLLEDTRLIHSIPDDSGPQMPWGQAQHTQG